MRKILHSRVAAVSVGAVVVVGLGASGAVAANLVNSHDIRNQSVRGVDIARGAIDSSELRNQSIRSGDVRGNSIGASELRADAIRRNHLDQGVLNQMDNRSEVKGLRQQVTELQESTVCTIPGAQFAINDNDQWTVLGKPFSTPTVEMSLGSDGVRLKTNAEDTYSDAGVIVPVGTVGDQFEGDTYVGPNLDPAGPLAVNLYVDSNDDQTYLNFGNGGQYINAGGDQIWFSYQGTPGQADLGADSNALVWAWTGVSGNSPQEATVGQAGDFSFLGCGD